MKHSAFLIIDVQIDFCPGGALAVPHGDEVIPILNRYIEYFQRQKFPILATRDWHPEKTKHFNKYGGQWPVHCVQNTAGAQFHPELQLPEKTIIFSKGMSEDTEGYSGFEGLDPAEQGLMDFLNEIGVRTLYIGGLATDYCVRATVLDALPQFEVYLLLDAVKGVDVRPGDSEKALKEMFKAGAKRMVFEDLP